MKKLVSLLVSFFTALAILTGSIAVPILVRPFYYAHIKPLNIESRSGLSEKEIKDAYNDVLDFCLGISDEFSAGVLKFSASGAAHFLDVKSLFLTDIYLFFVSIILVIITKPWKIHRAMSRGALGLGAFLLIAGIFAAVDFNAAFKLFHKLLFPHKTNWVFHADTDPVINILPIEFFRNCAILIAFLILTSIYIIKSLTRR